jgi:hypothetical protein
MTTTTTPAQPINGGSAGTPSHESAYVWLPIDALSALPPLLHGAAFHEAATRVEEQIADHLRHEERRAYVDAARDIYCNEGDDYRTEIDDNAIVSAGEDGAYVMAWCWVYKQDAGLKETAEGEPARRSPR